MAWIRLSDDYTDHPKFTHLSDGAFRLWHQAMGFCRKFHTDGLVPTASLRQFRSYRPARMQELLTPWTAGEQPLWHVVEGAGITVHDYLDWNLSKAEEQADKDAATARMRSCRQRKRHAERSGEPPGERSLNVLGRRGTGSGSVNVEKDREEKPAPSLVEDPVSERAGALVRRYQVLYAEYRHGAKYRQREALDWHEACSLVVLWDDARLDKLAILVLTTDDPWIANTDRSFKIFALKASWADDKLTEWEQRNGRV